tara:strand:- start:227 stop:496 length:270 start_codon:yes stop_codon:yes gene_type:complete
MESLVMKKEKAQLISGIGASSWFDIFPEGERYRINRYSEEGQLECTGIFDVEDTSFDISKKYKFTYISHCKKCTIIQNNTKYIFINNGY